MWRIGLDIGGTKIEALAVAPDGAEICRRRALSPKGDYPATLQTITALIASIKAECGIGAHCAIGAGIPGSLSPRTGLVRNANSTWLNGQPFKRDLEAALGAAVLIENDANCFALSETLDGAGAGFRSVFGIILGTGVGGGFIYDGALIAGRNAVAGEWGHNPLPWPNGAERDGPPCYCGKCGCIESFISGPALENQHFAATGERIMAADIAAKAKTGEPQALAALDVYCGRLARALAMVINIADPDVIVFGGGLSNIAAIIEGAQARLHEWVFSDSCETALRQNRWGDSSGVRGAAMLPLLRG